MTTPTSPITLRDLAVRGFVALVLVAMVAGGAWAQRGGKKTGILGEEGTRTGQLVEGTKKQWHPNCKSKLRRQTFLVIGLDHYRGYRPANLADGARARELMEQLCPGDRVSIYLVDSEADPLGEPVKLRDLSDVDDLVLRIEQRKEPRSWSRINHALLDAVYLEWGIEEVRDDPDLLRVLAFFTKDLESRKPKKAHGSDFSWASPPFWLHGLALTVVFRPISSDDEVKAWETVVVSVPAGVKLEEFEQGLRVDMTKFLEPARMVPEPKPVPKKTPRRIQVPETADPPGPPARAGEPDGTIIWKSDWTPWVIAGVLGILLLLVVVWALSRSAPRRGDSVAFADAPELTLVVHDRIHGTVIGQEKARLEGALRIGGAVTSDVVVPGPYAIELLPGVNGSSPRVRSTNALEVEIHRASGGRTLRASDTVPVPVRPGDRIMLGGGHELEVRYQAA